MKTRCNSEKERVKIESILQPKLTTVIEFENDGFTMQEVRIINKRPPIWSSG